MTIWSSGYKVRSIAKIDEEIALSQGADILSETFLFGVSGGLVVYEYNRSSAKTEKKEAARLQAIRDDAERLQRKLDSVDKRLVALEEYAKANRRSILGIGIGANGEYHEPDGVVPINDEEVENDNAMLNKDSGNINKKESPPAQESPNKSQGLGDGCGHFKEIFGHATINEEMQKTTTPMSNATEQYTDN
eukprot:CAMPEP_0183718814 /NCGR_PEP_ID=MMETSP0737-20130205/11974_1 /TAXON_ID=385413 /ORGANISM="Thalassiosira miniscula, Strain CCMP1093" /LENGTH=190 /DNA_ID=CAMNT_0025948435 /DNA_START=176 /DNA_END=749 /DNA_ORIENTATION=-